MKGFLKMNIEELKEAIIKKRAATSENLKDIDDLDFLREEFIKEKNGAYRIAYPFIGPMLDRWKSLQERRIAMQKVESIAVEYMGKPPKEGLYFEKIHHAFIKNDFQLWDVGFNENGDCIKKYFIKPDNWARAIIDEIHEFYKKEFA